MSMKKVTSLSKAITIIVATIFATLMLVSCPSPEDKQAEDIFFRLVKQMAEREGVTEQFKADNQMKWVARMNNIRSRATEIVNNDVIYN